MDYLLKKSDGSVLNLGKTVTKVKLPGQTKGDVVFVGKVRPIDIGKYVVIDSTTIVEPLSDSEKRGPARVVVDADALTVTITYGTMPKNTVEMAQSEISRLRSLETNDRLVEAILSDDGKAWLQANRDLIAAQTALL